MRPGGHLGPGLLLLLLSCHARPPRSLLSIIFGPPPQRTSVAVLVGAYEAKVVAAVELDSEEDQYQGLNLKI